jgi:sphingomyelin phosphodiesterase
MSVRHVITADNSLFMLTIYQNILTLLQGVAALGVEVFAQVLIEFCIAVEVGLIQPWSIHLKIWTNLKQMESADVCDGLMTMEASAFVFALNHMGVPSRTSEIFCFTVFGLCPYPPVNPFPFNFTEPNPQKNCHEHHVREPLLVVHISDIHVDHNYTVGASFNCTEDLCCHAYTPSEAPGVTPYPAGPFGNNNCDTPVSLEDDMYNAIKEIVPGRAFTIFSKCHVQIPKLMIMFLAAGDIPSTEWTATPEVVVFDITDAYNRMNSLGVLYGAVGNHEASPVNEFPPPTVVKEQNNATEQFVYDAVAAGLAPTLGAATAKKLDANSGSYSILHPDSNLKIISVNTMFWMKLNFWLYEETMELDPAGVLEFLVQELDESEKGGQRVWIIGHIAPGLTDFLYDYSASFDEIVQRYHETIAGMFWGHTHRDQFEISYKNYTDQTAEGAVAVSYITSSLTPTSGYPSFRVYSIDPVTYKVLDYTVYYANMSVPSFQTTGPTWKKLYSFKEAYGLFFSPPYTEPSAELTPAFVHNVTVLFENNDAVFQEYIFRKQRGFDFVPCTGTCKTYELCELRSAQSQFACYGSSPLSINKRSI